MAFEDLRDRLQSEGKMLWEKIQESSLYIQIQERYQNLSPTMQKITLTGIAVFLALLFFNAPLSYFSASNENVSQFEEKRQLIRDLLKVSRETQDGLQMPVPPDVSSLKSQVDNQIQAAQLLPEQIKGTEVVTDRSVVIPGNLINGMLRVSLAQLNLRQIIDLGYQFQSVSPSIKMLDLQMEASAKDPRYFDVIYKMAVLAVPSQNEAPGDEPAPPPSGRRKRQ
jgi:hypothetical protein